MIALTAAYEAEKNKQTGARPFDVLKVKFATGDLYIGIADYTINNWGGADRTVRGWMQEWGRVDDVITQPLDDAAALTGDMSIRLLSQDGQDGAGTFWTYLIDPANKPEQTVAELYVGFFDLDASTSPPVKKWSGMIKSWRWADEITLDVVLGDPSELIDQPLGRLVNGTNFPNADPDARGTLEPIIYGSNLAVPCRAIDAGPNSPISVDMTAAQTILYYSQTGTTFTATGTVYVGQEQITYTGKTTEVLNGVTHGKLTGLTRGVNSTTASIHKRGEVLIQVQSTYTFLIAGHPCKAVPALSTKDALGNLVLIPGTDYTVSLNNTGFPDGLARTTVAFTVLPTLVKQVNLSHTDTISNSDTLSFSGAQKSTAQSTTTGLPSVHSGSGGGTTVTLSGSNAFASLGTRINAVYTFNFSTNGFTGGHPTANLQMSDDAGTTWKTIYVIPPGGTPIVVASATGQINTTGDNNTVTFRLSATSAFPAGTYTVTINIDDRNVEQAATLTKSGAVTSTGTGGLTGNSAADVVVGAEIYADVDGYQDDGVGTYTGTASALIQKPADVIRHLLVTQMSLAFADFETSTNLAVKMGATYQINGPILQQRGGRAIASRMAFESGCRLKFEAGKARLTFLERQLSPARIITTREMFFLQGRAQSADVTQIDLNQIVNMLDVRYDRDWSNQSGGEDAYKAVSHAPPNAWSQTQYGERGGPPGKFNLDFVTTQPHADAVRDTWMDLYTIRRGLVRVRQALDGLDIQHGDAVTVCDRSARVVTGLVLSADYQPGPKIDPACTLTLMVIEEAAE